MSTETDMAFDAIRDRISGGPERRARRERIATAALQGILSHPRSCADPVDSARWAMKCADALIAELDKPEAAQ